MGSSPDRRPPTGRAARRKPFGLRKAVHKDDASYIPPEKYPFIHRAVLNACDRLDGVEDGVLEDPQKCKFDPMVLECKGADSPECLTHPQVEAARKIYAWSANPRTRQKLYSGLAPGSEAGWGTWGGPRPLSIALDYFRYVVFADPDWDFRTLNFDQDIERIREAGSRPAQRDRSEPQAVLCARGQADPVSRLERSADFAGQ